MSEIFIIYKKGIYIQGILGTATCLKDAVRVAKHAAEIEPDNYHDIVICADRVGRYAEPRIVMALERDQWKEFVQ